MWVELSLFVIGYVSCLCGLLYYIDQTVKWFRHQHRQEQQMQLQQQHRLSSKREHQQAQHVGHVGNQYRRGRLILFMGCMYASKTTHLILALKQKQIQKQACLLVKHGIDKRYTSLPTVLSHDKFSFEAVERHTLDVSRDKEWKKQVDAVDVIADLLPFCMYALSQRKLVMISCLNATYDQTMFPSISAVVPHATKVVFFQALCDRCGDKAVYSFLKERTKPSSKNTNTDKDSKEIKEEDASEESKTESPVCLGEKDLYEARCFHCNTELHQHHQQREQDQTSIE
jgi:thymidine kinase